jgi:hypothetical protein
MGEHDRNIKRLLRAFFRPFLAAFVPELHRALDSKSVQFLDKELIQARGGRARTKLVDLVARVRVRGEPRFVLVHVEHQGRRDKQIGWRLLTYAVWLTEQFGLPVYPILLTTYDQPRAAEPDRFVMEAPGLRVLEFRYRVVQLNRLDWRRFLRLKNPAATALMAKMNIRPEDRVKVKVQILRLLATMQLDREKMDLIAGFMDCYLALSAKEELAFQRDVAKIEDNKEKETVMELMTSWERKGRAEGWAEGRQAALVDLVNRQLARQVGALSSALARQVSRLNGAQLEQLAEALLKFTSADDLKRWLANAAAN